jgi:uncharacterized membrane protein YdjX (TVP38/TMEM64 family)
LSDGGDQPGGRKKLFSDLLRLLITGFVFFGLALLIRHGLGSDSREWLENLRYFLQGSKLSRGLWVSSALFVVFGGAAISVGIPRLWVSGAAGAIYGAALGVVLAMLSSIIGATTVYLLGRRLLASVVERRLGGQVGVWRRRFRQNAFWWVLYARLFPFSNATLASLLCGSCQVPLSTYLLASSIGFVPLTVVFAAFGSGGAKGNINQIWLGFGLLIAAFLVQLALSRMRPKSYAESRSTTG